MMISRADSLAVPDLYPALRLAGLARPDGKTAYVIAGGRVVPIRTATNRAGKAIKVGSQPRAIAITPDGKTAYVANYGSGTVTPINTATGTALKAIKVGSGPGGSGPGAIAITPDGKTAYVSNFSSGTVTPIRTATRTALKAIKVGYYPASQYLTVPLDGASTGRDPGR